MSSSINKKIFSLTALFLFCFPLIAQGQVTGNTPPPTNTGTGIIYECPQVTKKDANGNVVLDKTGSPVIVDGECTFQDLINAIQHVLDWGRNFALMFSVIVIAYAGYRYMISGDNPGERTKANKMLRSVVIGIIFILAAWLIVSLILKALGVNSVIKLS